MQNNGCSDASNSSGEVITQPGDTPFYFEHEYSPGKKVAITLHSVGGQAYCNTWSFEGGLWRKLMPELLFKTAPSNIMLSCGFMQQQRQGLPLNGELRKALDALAGTVRSRINGD